MWLVFIGLESSGGADGWIDETDVGAVVMEVLRRECDEKLLLVRLNDELGEALVMLSVSVK